MNILFLHPNFPAQFYNIAQQSAANNHIVKFLCQTHYGRTLKGVERVTLKNKAGHEELNRLKLPINQRTEALAKQYRDGFIALKKTGWNPDIVICHSGWGCGTYIKEVWPKTKQISYLEWWFNPQSSYFSYDCDNQYLKTIRTSIQKSWLRNQNIALELSMADEIVSPTLWQKSQLPESLKLRCHVIFDGIDLRRFRPIESSQEKRVNTLTYGTRGMDPLRCFPQLIKSLPQILKTASNLRLEIAGVDEAFYGDKVSPDGNSWGEWAQTFLKSAGISQQISWMGRLPAGRYEKWLRSSGCHIYLTHPFVASWSLVESYCSGVPIVASDVEPVREMCMPLEHVTLSDHRFSEQLSDAILSKINTSSTVDRSTIARQRAVERFGLDRSWIKWSTVAGL